MAKRAPLVEHALLRLIGLAHITRTVFAQVEEPLHVPAQSRVPRQSLAQRFVFGSYRHRHRRLAISATYRFMPTNHMSMGRTR
jgi:hypothetical protein